MKALSLRPPWGNAVLYLGKSIENRRWNTAFRGEFLIHAAKIMTEGGWSDACEFCEGALGVPRKNEILAALGRDPERSILRGGIVGRACLVDVVPPRLTEVSIESHYPKNLPANAWRWHMREQYGFVLEAITPLPFTPWPGKLNFFNVPFDRDGQREAA